MVSLELQNQKENIKKSIVSKIWVPVIGTTAWMLSLLPSDTWLYSSSGYCYKVSKYTAGAAIIVYFCPAYLPALAGAK